MVWSQGLHVWMPLPNSMALGLAEPGKAGFRLGQLSAAGAAGSFAALGVAIGACLFCKYVLQKGDYVPIRPLYIVAGAVAVLGAIACLRIPRHIKTPGPRLVFRTKYKLYYLLCLLEGWRKQVFIAFAGIFLVTQFHTSLMVMLILWSITQMVGYISSPIVGRIIDRVGERRVLLFYYVTMIAIFAGYSTGAVWGPTHPWMKYLLYALFVMDGSFFVLAMSLTTYVNRIAPQSEHTATLSMGVAMNHVSAVTMPFVGGILSNYGIKWTFLLGSSAAILSILASLCMPKHHTAPQGPPDDELTPSHAGVASREEV
jgi:MFS family permease